MARQNLFPIFRTLVLIGVILWSNSSISKSSDVKFENASIKLGSKILKVDLAESAEQQARGLMYVKKISDDYGMLFIYSESAIRHFWMKNTLVPLSIGFFDSDKKLFEIKNMKPMRSLLSKEIDTASSSKPAMYALEVNQGWFEKNKVTVGTKFSWINEVKPKTKKE